MTLRSACGLTARRTVAAPLIALVFDSVVATPRSVIFVRCALSGSEATIESIRTPLFSSPPTRLRAMLPAPMNAILSVMLFSRPEYRGADSDHRRTFCNRNLEISGHPHRECVPGCGARGLAADEQFPHAAKRRRLESRLCGWPWDRHQTAQSKPRQ